MMSSADATSSLLQACALGRPNRTLIDTWLQMGANINAQMTSGKTPLMLAAEAGDDEMVAFLISRGATVNQQNPYNGQTALMLAAWGGHADAAVRLYQAGALIGVMDTAGKSALDGASTAAHAALTEADWLHRQIDAARKTQAKLVRMAKAQRPPRL